MSKTAYPALSGVAIVAGFMLALLLLPGPALANQCMYSDGNHDNGPCVEVRNELNGIFGSYEMNLWCHSGPTARSHKIILLNNPDSFTCRGVSGKGTRITLQRTQIGCNTCVRHFSCQGKLVLKLGETLWGEEKLVTGACSIQ